MAYVSRRSRRRSAGSAEFFLLILVLVAGAGTAWWAGHRVGLDLHGISTAAALLGIGETSPAAHQAVGYTPGAAAEESTGAPAFCSSGQTPTFAAGIAQLKQQLGETMGTPIECEHAASADGNTIQQTTTGLAAFDRATNTASFTDGWRHWAITARGMVTWEGSDPNPPTG